MKTEVLQHDKARQQLLEGVNIVADLVGSTMGSSGKTVMISQGYGTTPIATKDGITVAASVMLENEIANVGVMCLKNAGDKTVKEAGDGTTQTIVLARALIKEGLRQVASGVQPQSLKRGIDKAVKTVVYEVQQLSEKVSSQDGNLLNIATISANNDTEIGLLIAEAYKKIGDNGLLNIEMSNTAETHIKVVDGFEFNRGYQHVGYVNVPEKMQVVYENPLIFVADYELNNIKDIAEILTKMVDSARPVIVIAKDFGGEVFSTLLANKIKGGLKICAIKAPNTYQKECLADIAVLTGATVVSDVAGIKLTSTKMEHLGTCEKIIVTGDRTTIINGAGDKAKVKEREEEINVLIIEATEKAVKDVHTKRLAQVRGSIGVIYVGASSDIEAREKLDRIDDAVRACKSAIEEGISAGGGVTLLRCISSLEYVSYENEDEKVGINIVKKSLEAPAKQILQNAGENDAYVIAQIMNGSGDYGYNVKTGNFCNLKDEGVIDPTKVIRVALQNAASVAGSVITSDGLIVNMRD